MIAITTDLEKLYQEVADKGIEVYKHFFKVGDKSKSLNLGSLKFIGLNFSSLKSTTEEKIALAEEMAHFETDSFYHIKNDYNTPLQSLNRMKAEHKAKVWVFEKLLPYTNIQNAINSCSNIHELAEHLEVPEQTLREAIAYYQRKGIVFELMEY